MPRAKSIALSVVALLGASVLLNVVGAGSVLADTMKPLLVHVINGTANRVPVLAIPDQPFRGFVVFSVEPGTTGGHREITTVPAGKLLVIETITVGGLSTLDGDMVAASLVISHGGGTFGDTEQYHVAFERVSTSTVIHYAGTHNVRIYIDPESRVDFDLIRDGSNGDTIARMTLSGYFVDIP